MKGRKGNQSDYSVKSDKWFRAGEESPERHDINPDEMEALASDFGGHRAACIEIEEERWCQLMSSLRQYLVRLSTYSLLCHELKPWPNL